MNSEQEKGPNVLNMFFLFLKDVFLHKRSWELHLGQLAVGKYWKNCGRFHQSSLVAVNNFGFAVAMAAMEIGEDTPMLLPHQSMCRTARSRKKRHEYVSHESGPWVVVLKVYESKTWKEGNTLFFEELDYMIWDFQSCWVRSMMTWISMFLFWRLFLHVFYMSLKMPNLPFLLWEGIHYTQFFQICFLLHFQPKNMFDRTWNIGRCGSTCFTRFGGWPSCQWAGGFHVSGIPKVAAGGFTAFL